MRPTVEDQHWKDFQDLLEEECQDVVRRAAGEAGIALSPTVEEDLAANACKAVNRKLGGYVTRRLAEGGEYADAELWGQLKPQARDYAGTYVKTLLADVGAEGTSLSHDSQAWAQCGSLENVAAFAMVLPQVIRARRELFGSPDPLSPDEAVRWLEENDEPDDGVRIVRVILLTDESTVDRVFDVISSGGAPALGELATAEVISLEEEAAEKVALLDEGGTHVRTLITFRGRRTAQLADAAQDIQDQCGSFKAAVWLILAGIWPGRRLEPVPRSSAGRPPLSLEQECLVYAALEEQAVGGRGTFGDAGFYEAVLARWLTWRDRIADSLHDHPRFQHFDTSAFSTTETVRKALQRVRLLLCGALGVAPSTATRKAQKPRAATSRVTPATSRRDRRAVESMWHLLAKGGWVSKR